MVDRLPKLSLNHDVRPYALATLLAHLPSFDDKMRVHSFGGRCRWSANMPQAWRDVEGLEESGVVDDAIRFRYRSLCAPREWSNGFTLSCATELRYNNALVCRTLSPSSLRASSFDAMLQILADVMSFVRGKTRDLRRFSTNGVGLTVFGDGAEWMPRLMLCRLRKFGYISSADSCVQIMSMPKLPSVRHVGVSRLSSGFLLELLLHTVCTHGNQLTSFTITPTRTAGDSPMTIYLPSEHIVNDARLRRINTCALILSHEQMEKWPAMWSVQGIRFDRPFTLVGAIRQSALLFAHGRSLTRIVGSKVSGDPNIALFIDALFVDAPDAEQDRTSRRALGWGMAFDWRAMEAEDIMSTDVRVQYDRLRSTAVAIVDIIDSIRKSSTPSRRVTLKLCAPAHLLLLPLGHRVALRHMLNRREYKESTASLKLTIGDGAEVDVEIEGGTLLDVE